MKNFVAAILSTATIAGVVASGTTAFATQTIDGREGDTSGNVQVNGIIGEFDNTTSGPNPDDLNHWINVTVPTTAVFYTTETSSHKEIVSPTYTVTNNSAVGVIASVSGVDTPSKMSEVNSLKVNSIELFGNGEPSVTKTELFTLEGNQGKNEGTFAFTGAATPSNTAQESNPSFNLVLSFAPDVVED
ncbi:hypothetical protein ACFC90_10975 [Enterococcus casseliflavus]|uniref:hypothetical protein n=1 Tax=Enterococcus casseliflavus TaxID=37734 RepID=UPI0039A54CF1